MSGIERHRPVLLESVLRAAAPVLAERPNPLLLDGTLGAGGHSRALLEAAPSGAVLVAVDRDREAIERSREPLAPFGERARLHVGSHADLGVLAKRELEERGGADLLIVDLGLSSDQLGAAERGFSFRLDGPLDMRFDTDSGETALDLIGELSWEELARSLRELGEVRGAGRVAREIKSALDSGQLTTTHDLASVVEQATRAPRAGRIHPATLVFQALRLLVNDELGHVRELLARFPAWLRPGGRLLVIGFHSLEDRLAKHALRYWEEGPPVPRGLPVLPWPAVMRRVPRRPIKPSDEEIADNPRARSAKLRVAERTDARVPEDASPWSEQ